jgi:hypothetical protein
MMRSLVAVTVLAALATPVLADPGTYDTEVTHYNNYTLAADGLAIGALLGGFAAEGPGGRDTTASSTLMAVGLAGGFLATPIIHLVRGHTDRALGSFLMRSMISAAAMGFAVATASCSPDAFLCGADRIGPGVAVGLAVSSLLDSVFLTSETVAKPSSWWAPQIAPTAGGVRLGLVASF